MFKYRYCFTINKKSLEKVGVSPKKSLEKVGISPKKSLEKVGVLPKKSLEKYNFIILISALLGSKVIFE